MTSTPEKGSVRDTVLKAKLPQNASGRMGKRLQCRKAPQALFVWWRELFSEVEAVQRQTRVRGRLERAPGGDLSNRDRLN